MDEEGTSPTKRSKVCGGDDDDDDDDPGHDEDDARTPSSPGEGKSSAPAAGHGGNVSDTGAGDGGLMMTMTPAFIHQYQVVKSILEHLKFRDLLQASQVNRQWRDIGRIVRRQRRNLAGLILYHPYLPHSKLAFEYFNGFDVSEEASQLVESGDNGYFPYKKGTVSNSKKLFPGLVEGAKNAVDRFLEESYDEVEMLISFGTSSLHVHLTIERAFKGSKERIMPVLAKIYGRIPCLTSFSCGLVATLPECNKSLEMEKNKFPSLSCLAVPKVPGLRMKLFAVTKSQNHALRGKETVEQCKALLGIDEETEPNLKGIILLHKPSQRHVPPVVEAICRYLKSNPNVGLAGGVHDNVLVSGTADDKMVAGGVLIYGDESVRVSTAALTESHHSKPDTCSQKLEELKTTLLPDGNSFAFMFACNGRGRYMHGRPNVESDLFNSVFPKTPLTGTFTYGEFCHEVAVPYPGKPEGIKAPENIGFGYHTIFLVVSYKHPKDASKSKSEAN